MAKNALANLALLIEQQRDPLLEKWRSQVRLLHSARDLDTPTLNDHVPSLLQELAHALKSRSDETIAEALMEGSPPAHGVQRVKDDFDIEEVVAEYNILRDCIHDLADQNGITLQGAPFHILNRVLDSAIGLAVQAYATQRALETQHRREEYLAFVAHDLRTPLNAISLAARVLELTHPERNTDAETAQMLRSLHRNVQHLEGLVAKILEENANMETEVGVKLERRTFDLWPFVESLVHDLHPVAGTASTQLVNVVPEELTVFADASLLRRVFQNLIANAIRHTPHGVVIIGARHVDLGGAVECWVRDNGTGIPTEELERVFDKSETGVENPDGNGLGLAIVKTFVEAHDGKVTVESKVGLGSTFRFTLPPKRAAAQA